MPGRKYVYVALVVVLGLILSTAVSRVVRERDRALTRSTFERIAAGIATSMQREIDEHAEVVSSIASLFDASVSVEREEFRLFTERALGRHSAIQALEWIPRVPASRRADYENVAKRDGLSGFRITEGAPEGEQVPAGVRGEYFPVYYAEPMAGNEVALGFDLGSDSTRLAALAEARDTGMPVATGRITLVQETGNRYGYLLLVPFYRSATPPNTVEERRKALVGFALGVFRVGDFVTNALGKTPTEGIAFELHDDSASPGEGFLGSFTATAGKVSSRAEEGGGEGASYRWAAGLTVPGRRWRVEVFSTPAFEAGVQLTRDREAFGSGVVITLLFATYLATAFRRASQLETLSIRLSETNRDMEREIVERRRAEEEIRRSEAKYRQLVDLLPLTVYECDAEGTITYVSRAVEETFGYSQADFDAGLRVADILVPEDRSRAAGNILEILSGVKSPGHEYRVLNRTGMEVPALIYSSRVLLDGRPVGLRGIVIDLSDRKRAEEALRASEEKFREMAENIREVFWLFDLGEQRVVYVSPAYGMIWGRSPSSLLERYGEWEESIHPDDRDAARESFSRISENGGGEPRVYRIIRPDGTVRWIEDRGFPIRDDAGRVVRIAGIAEDITERIRAEEQRRQLEEKIRQSQKLESLGVLAGGIAHDFNNLLMGILGHADIALMRLPRESPGREHIRKIVASATTAAELTNQMLAYSGKGHFLVEPIDVNRLVEETAHLLQTVISKKATLRFDIARDLPAIEADASQVRQVVMNLITNASEALDEGTGFITLSTGVMDADREYLAACYHLESVPEGRYVFLEVSDTGGGMDEKTIRKVFDPFFTTKLKGRGLGLAAVLGIVRGHRGAIRIQSEPGRGTSFKVLFPASEAMPPPPADETRPEPEAPVTGTVLVVDDDPAVRDVARSMLEEGGFRVLTAIDGQEGVDTYRRHRDEISVVLLDMTMPVLSGEETFGEIRRIRSDVRVVLSSGYSESDATKRFAGKGLAGFVQKPYRAAQLLEKVRAALGRR